VETSPGVFDFKSELELISIAAEYGLEVILVASTHACGSNVGDSFKTSIPKFYAQVGSPMSQSLAIACAVDCQMA
jgi:hypothetical protein